MDSQNLKYVLKQYEQKRFKALEDLEKRKNDLYKKNKRLQEIDMELSNAAINFAKSILNSKENSISLLEEKKEKLKKEKLKILNSLNLDEKYLEPHFECSICNDTGYINNGLKSIMCNCLKQELFNIEYNKSNIGNLEKENFENFNENLYSEEINHDKYRINISPRENIKKIKNIAINFINNFENPDEKNLIFIGNSGLGKTFLSNCIANEILKKNKTVLYQTAPVMLDEIINYRFGKSNSNQNIIENLLNVDLLIIDDLGTENINSMKFVELFNIINTRILNQNKKITKTIISTNLSLQNIYSIYDERIASRIVGYYTVCKFYGDDIRFK